MGARKIKLLADENIHISVCNWLRQLRRFDLVTVKDVSLSGKDDEVVVKYATTENRVLLAADKVFSEHNYPICEHAGILNVWRFNAKPATLRQRLSKVFRKARRFLHHNVTHLGEEEFWIVEAGNRKRVLNYR